MLSEDPSLAMPYVDIADPSLMKDLKLREDPKWTKSSTDNELPIRAIP
jgi:hypothetical protein